MFHGSIVALATPMCEDGSIDYRSLQHLLDWHVQNGTDGIVVLGTTGESPTITMAEREKIIRLAVTQVNKKLPVIAGTGVNSTTETIHLTEQAMALGVDACLVVTPYYNKPTQEGLYRHFKLVAEKVAVPQILYNVPPRTACDLLPETIARLAKISNIVGVKEASADITRVQTILKEHKHLDLLSGDDATALAFMLAGGKGVISVTANVAPKQMHELCKAALQGKEESAQRINAQLLGLHKQLFIEANPIPVKWALQQMKLIAEGIRLPLTPLSQEKWESVSKALAQAGIHIN